MIAPLPAMAQEPEPPIASAPIEMVAGLAEVLGRAHAVRTVCNGDTDSTWRNYMLNLMAIEAPLGFPPRGPDRCFQPRLSRPEPGNVSLQRPDADHRSRHRSPRPGTGGFHCPQLSELTLARYFWRPKRVIRRPSTIS
jgi:hypothetical protein